MSNTFSRVVCVLLVCAMGILSLPLCAQADGQPTAMDGGPALVLAAGALVVNAGATIANGAALAAGKPDRGRGMFGVVLGGASLVAAAAVFALSDDETDPEGFSAVLAGCGLASLLTGYLNVRGAEGSPPDLEQSLEGRTDKLAPRVAFGAGPDWNGGWVAAVRVGF